MRSRAWRRRRCAVWFTLPGGDPERWVKHLDGLGVEHPGVVDVPIGGIVDFTDSDGIQLAVFWERPAGAT